MSRDKNLQDFWRFCQPLPRQGLLPTSRHFEHRRGEGPGDEVGLTVRCEVHFGLWQFSACRNEKKKKKKAYQSGKKYSPKGKKNENKNKQKIK